MARSTYIYGVLHPSGDWLGFFTVKREIIDRVSRPGFFNYGLRYFRFRDGVITDYGIEITEQINKEIDKARSQ